MLIKNGYKWTYLKNKLADMENKLYGYQSRNWGEG